MTLRPTVGVGAVLIQDGRVLLVKRGKEPLRGRWVIPGGTVEPGEHLEAALIREIEEETGLEVRIGELLTVFDRIQRDREGRLEYHYVILDYLCELTGGSLRAGSDADAVALVGPAELASYDLPEKAFEVVREGFRRRGLPFEVALPNPPTRR
ncbi:MAG: NUDIX hydrolase [Acidobacteria bacterium]|nr:NUDIX hydrolase [Acidobacteriota bacterium]